MTQTGTFLTLGGIAVSLAGFASLLFSLHKDEHMSRLMAWRIRYIVTGGLVVAMISFVAVAIGEFTRSETTFVRACMVLVLLTNAAQAWSYRSLRDPEVFRSKTEVRGWVVGAIVTDLVVVLNLLIASPALMVAIWVWLVISPMTIFVNVVAEIYTPQGAMTVSPVDPDLDPQEPVA